MRSTKESSTFNIIMVAIHLFLIVFVIAAGFPFVKAANYDPFLPFGMRGVFSGASVVFFSFIGFDTVATAAEEVKNPSRDLPIGIIGSLSICTVLYVLMCLVITGMQPYNEIDIHAPFSVAFDAVGLHWARTIVALGALAGIMTSLLGSLLGQARIYVILGRQHLLPPWIARVSEHSGTPRNAAKVRNPTYAYAPKE
jgi:APA family basic amino acid/polyamine antiporter